MKHLLKMAFCLVFITVSCAMASPRIGQTPEGICTRDINLWGNAGQCTCDDGKIYDDRAGLCIEGEENEQILVQGPVSTQMAAIGGETTGIVITTPEGESYELIVPLADQEKMKKLDGLWFEIAGELITIKSTELQERRAIIVDKIAVLE